jgi:hypothetical protein
MPGRALKSKDARAVERVIDSLGCLASEKPPVNSSRTSEECRSPPGTQPAAGNAHRQASCEGELQRFALDFGVGRLADSWSSGIDTMALARPVLKALRNPAARLRRISVISANVLPKWSVRRYSLYVAASAKPITYGEGQGVTWIVFGSGGEDRQGRDDPTKARPSLPEKAACHLYWYSSPDLIW